MLFNNPTIRKIIEIPLVQIRPSKTASRKVYSRDKLNELDMSLLPEKDDSELPLYADL